MEYGEQPTKESLKKDVLQCVEKSTLKGVPVEKNINKDNINALKIIVNAKKNADREFQSLKTRGVARGDLQTKTKIYQSMSSPTASCQGIFTEAAVADYENRNVATYDFP